jgi:hypothetical protein
MTAPEAVAAAADIPKAMHQAAVAEGSMFSVKDRTAMAATAVLLQQISHQEKAALAAQTALQQLHQMPQVL